MNEFMHEPGIIYYVELIHGAKWFKIFFVIGLISFIFLFTRKRSDPKKEDILDKILGPILIVSGVIWIFGGFIAGVIGSFACPGDSCPTISCENSNKQELTCSSTEKQTRTIKSNFSPEVGNIEHSIENDVMINQLHASHIDLIMLACKKRGKVFNKIISKEKTSKIIGEKWKEVQKGGVMVTEVPGSRNRIEKSESILRFSCLDKQTIRQK